MSILVIVDVSACVLVGPVPGAALEIFAFPAALYAPANETNANEFQRTVLDEAQDSSWILFFDEADALFGKRTDVQDAHDRYDDIEVNYLLDDLELFVSALPPVSNLLVFREQDDSEDDVRRLHDILAADPDRLVAAGLRDLWLIPTGGVQLVAEPSTGALSLMLAGFALRRIRKRRGSNWPVRMECQGRERVVEPASTFPILHALARQVHVGAAGVSPPRTT